MRHMATSTLRALVEQELNQRGTTLTAYLAAAAAEGRSLRATAPDLAHITGIPIATRTLYRWAADLEAAS